MNERVPNVGTAADNFFTAKSFPNVSWIINLMFKGRCRSLMPQMTVNHFTELAENSNYNSSFFTPVTN